MRRPIIAYIDNGLPVQLLSRRDFLFGDADEKYVPAVLAYIHDTNVGTLNRLLYTRMPEEVVATFPYLSDLEKKVRLPGLVRPVGGTAGGRGEGEGEADAAAPAPHGMDDAAKVQWSRGGPSYKG